MSLKSFITVNYSVRTNLELNTSTKRAQIAIRIYNLSEGKSLSTVKQVNNIKFKEDPV